jgi:hypothetical protein
VTIHDDSAPPLPLPGLEPPGSGHLSPLQRAVRRSAAALDAMDLLEEHHAMDLEACRILAASAEKKLATGRMSTLSGDLELMLKVKQNILTPPEDGSGSVDEDLRQAMADFSAALDGAES